MLSCTGLLLSGSEIADGALARWRKAFDPTLEARQRTSYRSELARAGLTIGVENPGLGVGTGGFGTAQYSQSPRLGLRSGHAAAHSAWVKVLAENGLPGLVLLLGFVASYAVLGRRGRRRRLGLVTVVFLSTAMLWTQFASKVLWMTAAFAAVAVCGREPECDEGRRP
jgi:O-antigen ligase